MPDYANAKIYKIVGEDGSTYYGSTVQSLRERLYNHRGCPTTTAYQKIISKMDWEMILVENYPCESRKELDRREGWYIRENPCVNLHIAGRSHKEWYRDNVENVAVRHKKNYGKNRERILEYNKEYHKRNRNHVIARCKRRGHWVYSFGDSRYTNCIQRCDYMLFQ